MNHYDNKIDGLFIWSYFRLGIQGPHWEFPEANMDMGYSKFAVVIIALYLLY